jgi:hypothetical protein
MKTNTSFSGFSLKNGILFDLSDDLFPTILHGWLSSNSQESYQIKNPNGTTFGYVYNESAILTYNNLEIPLIKGMYFSIPGGFKITGGSGILIEYLNYTGFFNIGGPIEAWGRLNYIDGCTDSLLIQPIKKGDPCLNSLYFPPNILQTQHTHPSVRIGIVTAGRGVCVIPQEDIPLLPGLVFIIHTEGAHSFKTSLNEKLTVVSFHPDSDFGPEDENHPMINRTIVDGISANQLKNIHTN